MPARETEFSLHQTATRQTASGLPAAIIVACAVGVLPVLWTLASMLLGQGRSPSLHGLVASRDFATFWIGGQLGLRGIADPHWIGELFTPEKFALILKAHWPFLTGQRLWSYPPPMLLFATALAWLPIGLGWLLLALAGIAAMSAALTAATGVTRRDALLCVLLAPATWDCIFVGQNALLFGAAVLGGLALAARRPLWSGILLGIATGKPQFGVTTPLALIAARAWRAILCAVATSLVLAGISAWLWPAAWHLWLAQVVPAQTARMTRDFLPTPSQSYLATLYEFIRGLGIGRSLAGGMQMVLSAAAMVWVGRGFVGIGTARRPLALLGAVALLPVAAPYLMDYDLAVVQCLALAILLTRRAHLPAGAASGGFLALVPIALIGPGFAFILSVATKTPPLAWLPIAALGLVALHLARSRA